MRILKKSKSTSKVKVGGESKRSLLPIWSKVLLVLVIAVGGAYTLTRAFADSSSLYISPASTSIQSGSNFTVAVRLTPVSNVDGIVATITYNPNVLQFVSVDTANSGFPVSLVATGGNGKVDIERGALAPATVSTDTLVANVTFTALSATSSTPLTLTGNSTYQGTYLNPGTSGATVTITSPAPPPATNDTTAPKVTVSSPADGAQMKGKASVNATASDDSGKVVKMEVYVDGGIVQTSTSGSITYKWGIKSNGGGHKNTSSSGGTSHTVTVKAYDPTGNVGSAAITVKS
jgi:hypothetical protein